MQDGFHRLPASLMMVPLHGLHGDNQASAASFLKKDF
jgi:hypothetical protein